MAGSPYQGESPVVVSRKPICWVYIKLGHITKDEVSEKMQNTSNYNRSSKKWKKNVIDLLNYERTEIEESLIDITRKIKNRKNNNKEEEEELKKGEIINIKFTHNRIIYVML